MAKSNPIKKSESLREKAAKASKKAAAPSKHRVRGAASAAGRPIKRLHSISTSQYHLIQPRESGIAGFLTKPRRIIPQYFKNSFSELREVTWPNRKTSWKLVFAVFAFAIVFGVAIAIVDYGLETIFKRIIL